jgi:DNA-binding SARP family transcriptional activator/predicted ATPase
MPHLCLSFLGSWKLTNADGRPIPIRIRKEQALLTYLAVEKEQAHSREALIGLFWPDLAEQMARNNLRVTLSRLQRRIGQQVSPLLITSRHEIQFNLDNCHRIDVADFQALIAAGQTNEGAKLKLFQQAADLYQGDFLAGFYLDNCQAFEEWVFIERERLRVQVINALQYLTDAYEQLGQLETAYQYAQRQIALDPLSEMTYRCLMRLLARQGQRSAALAQFSACRHILNEELGLEPEPETLALYEQIKNGHWAPVQAPPAEGGPQAGRPQAEPELTNLKHNLPAQLTPFIGREVELSQLGQHLSSSPIRFTPKIFDNYRLLTLIGPGGIGKTRLALQAAAQQLNTFPDGVYFVPLAAVQTADAVPAAIAEALGMTFMANQKSPQVQLIDMVRHKTMLLVLDNLEHLLPVTDYLLELLEQAPGLVLLITSRESLNVQAEDLFYLTGLPVPPPSELSQATNYAAVRLFLDRAHRLQKNFKLTEHNLPDVVRICELVEGLPLGIELAATWVNDYSCAEIARGIERSLDFLTTTLRDLSPSHRSLRATFEHSWQRLSAEEQAVLSQLAIFQGGFSGQAAQIITGATPLILSQLRYKSLLHSAGAGRYDLHELLRQFTLQKLVVESPSQANVYERHSRFYLDFVGQRTETLQIHRPYEVAAEIQRDLDNIRQAWQWAVAHSAVSSVVHSAAALGHFYELSGLYEEGVCTFEKAITQLKHGLAGDSDVFSPEEGRRGLVYLLAEQARLLGLQGKYHQALSITEQVIKLAGMMGDRRSEVRGYLLRGQWLKGQGDTETSLKWLHQALARAQTEQFQDLMGEILLQMGNTWKMQGNHDDGLRCLEQALQIQASLGNRVQEQRIRLYLGVHAIEEGDYMIGYAYLEQAARLMDDTGDRFTEARIANALGFLDATLGNYQAALLNHERSRQISREVGDAHQESHALHNLCVANYMLGNLATADANGQQALAIAQQLQIVEAEAFALNHWGYVLAALGRLAEAQAAFEQACAGWKAVGHQALAIEARSGLAHVAFQRGNLVQAQKVVDEILSFLAKNTLEGTDEPFRVYLTCYKTLKANQDSRAFSLLKTAYETLQEQAMKITDQALRISFLNDVAVNRELIKAWQAAEKLIGAEDTGRNCS